MTVKAIESQGVTLKYTVGSPTGMAGIANVTAIRGPSGSASVIDVTNLLSTFKEKLMGLPDEGQISLDLNFDPDDTSHQALRGARASRTRTEFLLTLTDSTPATGTFWGYVLSFTLDIGVDKQVTASLTIEVDGPIAWA